MKPPDILIRVATLADAEGIATVHVASWQSTYRGIMPDDVMDGLSVEQRTRQWQQVLQTIPADHCVFVATTAADEIVGFANGGPSRESDTDFAGELYAIYLLATVQHSGIGRRLVGAVAHHLVQYGLNSMLVLVAAQNPSRFFYDALGAQWLREQDEDYRGMVLHEAVYGWRDITALAAM